MDRRADESPKIMTIERELDPDATEQLPRPKIEQDLDEQDLDPEKTLVREDWETTVIRRVAPHLAAVLETYGLETLSYRRAVKA